MRRQNNRSATIVNCSRRLNSEPCCNPKEGQGQAGHYVRCTRASDCLNSALPELVCTRVPLGCCHCQRCINANALGFPVKKNAGADTVYSPSLSGSVCPRFSTQVEKRLFKRTVQGKIRNYRPDNALPLSEELFCHLKMSGTGHFEARQAAAKQGSSGHAFPPSFLS